MDSLEELLDDVWNRWREAFSRFDVLKSASRNSHRIVYANASLFPLKNYTPRKFPAGGRAYPEQPQSTNSYHRYQLDAKGHPIHMASGHTFNHFDWEGFYLYSEREVEYIEFCLQTQVVSQYTRMALEKGVPRTYQDLRVNGGGSHIGGRTGLEAMHHITQNSYFYQIQIEEYTSSEGQIVAGKALLSGFGQPSYRSDIEYSYSDSGKLERIVLVREDGSRYTSFAATSKVSMQGLSGRISERIATRTIEAIESASHSAPLQAVEMSFRSVTNYLPMIILATERDSVSDMGLILAIDHRHWISLKDEDFEPDLTDFIERLKIAENWDPGSKMLRQAARMVTERVPDSLTVAEGFVAYAIDWEFEGQELVSILKQCGASTNTLKKLRKIGWLA